MKAASSMYCRRSPSAASPRPRRSWRFIPRSGMAASIRSSRITLTKNGTALVMPTIGVFASIFDHDKRALCVRQNYGERLWTTPGGRLEAYETPLDGLLREVREEIGAEIEVLGFVGAYANAYKDDLVLNFHARLIGSIENWRPHDEIG